MAFSQDIPPRKLRVPFASVSALFVITSIFISITTCSDVFDNDIMKWKFDNYYNYRTKTWDTPKDLTTPPGKDDNSPSPVIFVLLFAVLLICICTAHKCACDVVDEDDTSSNSPRSDISRPVRLHTNRDNWIGRPPIRATPAIFTIATHSPPPAVPSPTRENDMAPAYESPPAYNECVINMDFQKR